MKTNLYRKNIVDKDLNIRDSLEQLELISPNIPKILFVCDSSSVMIGTVSDGDIRRALIQNEINLESPIQDIMNRDFKCIYDYDDITSKFEIFKQNDLKLIPYLDNYNRILKFIDLENLKAKLPMSALIMAGGKGTRLRPITNEIPKPLVKIGDKPIIQHNIDRLINFGVDEIFISVNYMKDKIIDFIDSLNYTGVEISFVIESKQLGTIGSLGLIKKLKYDNILVMNSDILTDINFSYFYKNHTNMVTLGTITHEIKIPYGVIEYEGQLIKSIVEKPTHRYETNSGIYLVNKSISNLIPKNQKFDATDLIELLIPSERVSFCPLNCYWLDIGKHDDLAKANNDIHKLNLNA